MSIRPENSQHWTSATSSRSRTLKAVDLWPDVVTELPDRARELGSLSKAELGKAWAHCSTAPTLSSYSSRSTMLAAEALHDGSVAGRHLLPEAPTLTTPPTSCAN